MTYLDDAIDWLAATLDESDGQSLTYSRGAVSETVTGQVGSSVLELSGEFGQQRIETRDFLITASRLSTFGEPRRGDRITETQGGSDVLHEVLDLPGIPAFSYSDQGKRRLRIHTKRIM